MTKLFISPGRQLPSTIAPFSRQLVGSAVCRVRQKRRRDKKELTVQYWLHPVRHSYYYCEQNVRQVHVAPEQRVLTQGSVWKHKAGLNVRKYKASVGKLLYAALQAREERSKMISGARIRNSQGQKRDSFTPGQIVTSLDVR